MDHPCQATNPHRECPPASEKTKSFGGHSRCGMAFFQHYATIHYLLRSRCPKAVGGVPELAVLYTRPCGVPSLGREPPKAAFRSTPSARTCDGKFSRATDSDRARQRIWAGTMPCYGLSSFKLAACSVVSRESEKFFAPMTFKPRERRERACPSFRVRVFFRLTAE